VRNPFRQLNAPTRSTAKDAERMGLTPCRSTSNLAARHAGLRRLTSSRRSGPLSAAEALICVSLLAPDQPGRAQLFAIAAVLMALRSCFAACRSAATCFRRQASFASPTSSLHDIAA
jgi:hypothetical protein